MLMTAPPASQTRWGRQPGSCPQGPETHPVPYGQYGRQVPRFVWALAKEFLSKVWLLRS